MDAENTNIKSMKSIRFQKANSSDGKVFLSNINNSIIMKFKPSFWDKVKILIGFPIWVGAPIKAEKGKFSLKVVRKAFIKKDDD